MINVFRSKEVYKNINTEFADRVPYPMIPVRGVYVAGEWRPVFYADHMVFVESVSSTKANVNTYVTHYDVIATGDPGQSVNLSITNNQSTNITGIDNYESDDWLTFLGIDIDDAETVDVIDFTQRKISENIGDWVTFLGIDVEPNELDIVDFINTELDVKDDWVTFLGIDIDINELEFVDITIITTTQFDCMVRIISVGGTKATISH